MLFNTMLHCTSDQGVIGGPTDLFIKRAFCGSRRYKIMGGNFMVLRTEYHQALLDAKQRQTACFQIVGGDQFRKESRNLNLVSAFQQARARRVSSFQDSRYYVHIMIDTCSKSVSGFYS